MAIPQIYRSQWPQHLRPTAYTPMTNFLWNALLVVSGSAFTNETLTGMINSATIKDRQKLDALVPLRSKLSDPDGQYRAEIVQMQAPDEVVIEGAFFSNSSKNAILFALGAGGCYESIANPEDAAHDFVKFFQQGLDANLNILVINTRGIGRSTGTASIQGAALDYYTAWNYLESKGLHVLPWGHSLGFRYIVVTAAWKQKEYPDEKISIVSDRSFDDIANLAKESKGGGFMGTAAGLLTQHAGWGGNIEECWNSLKGKKLIMVAPNDPIIPYAKASFFQRTLAKPTDNHPTVILLNGTERAHTRIYNEEEKQKILEAINPVFV